MITALLVAAGFCAVGAATMPGLIRAVDAQGGTVSNADGEGQQQSMSAGADIPEAEQPVLQRAATPFENEILADGKVTREELLRAFRAADECIAAAANRVGGVEVHAADYSEDIPRFGGLSATEKNAFNLAGQAELDCVEAYYNHVYAGYGMAASYAAKQAIWDRTGECLRARGYVVTPGANRQQLALAVGQPGQDISDFYTCERQASP